ncbi:MAG: hypothetical protein R6X06_10455 [Gammaproteobacteria bacterium]
MHRLVMVLVFFCCLAPLRAESALLLSWAEWSVPRTAEAVLAMPVLQEAMQGLRQAEHASLRIYYPGGDEGSLWAIELRGWLVSLGLEADRIKLISGSQYPDRLQLEIEE